MSYICVKENKRSHKKALGKWLDTFSYTVLFIMLSTRSFEFTLDFSFVLSLCDLGENDTDDFLLSVASITSLRRRAEFTEFIIFCTIYK